MQQKQLLEEEKRPQEADSEKKVNTVVQPPSEDSEVLWKIKRRTLEDLFGFKFGDDASSSGSRPPSQQASEPPPPPSQQQQQPPILNWLWCNRGGDPKDYVRQLRKRQPSSAVAFSDDDEEEDDVVVRDLDDVEDDDDLECVAPIAMLRDIDERRLTKPVEK